MRKSGFTLGGVEVGVGLRWPRTDRARAASSGRRRAASWARVTLTGSWSTAERRRIVRHMGQRVL